MTEILFAFQYVENLAPNLEGTVIFCFIIFNELIIE
jgi:hypothetical protein